jgi:hypothetical protein
VSVESDTPASRHLDRLGAAILVAGALVYLSLGRGRWVHDAGDQANWFTDIENVLAGGRVLHEVRIHLGPLSVWFLSALCRLFGARVAVVAAAQFAVGLAAVVALQLLSASFLSLPERAACAAALTTGILWMPGDANVFFPSTFANTQGLLLALAALACGRAAARSAGLLGWAAAGFLAGLAALTKQEMGGVAALGIVALVIAGSRRSWPARAAAMASAAAAALATCGAVLLVAARGEPLGALARRNSLWPLAPVPPALGVLFARYQAWGDFGRVPLQAVDTALAVGTAAFGLWLCVSARRLGRRGLAAGLLAMALAGCLFFLRWSAGAGVSLLSLAAPALLPAVLLALRRARRCAHPEEAAMAAALGTGALLLLWRVGYRPLPDHVYSAYGYFLAIPPLTMLAGTAVRRVAAPPGRRWLAAAAAVAAMAWGARRLIALETEWAARSPFSTFRGTIWIEASWREALPAAAARIESITRPGERVFIVPSPRMLDFLLDRPNASFYAAILGGLDPAREQELISLWEREPPKVVVRFEGAATFFRRSEFGVDFGRDALAWIERRCALLEREARPRGIGWSIYGVYN